MIFFLYCFYLFIFILTVSKIFFFYNNKVYTFQLVCNMISFGPYFLQKREKRDGSVGKAVYNCYKVISNRK